MLKKIIFILLLFCVKNVVAQKYTEHNMVHYARYDSTDFVIRCLDAGVNPDATEDDGYTALMLAADRGNYRLCEELLKRGADPNKLAPNSPSPLKASVIANYPMVADLLLQYGARMDLDDEYPLAHAVFFGFIECAQVLLYHHADPEFVLHKKSLMQYAAYTNDTAMAQLLKLYGAQPDKEVNGATPLLFAAEYCSDDMIKWLLSEGANVNYEDSKGYTPAYYAARFGCLSSLKLLKENNADFTKKIGNKNIADECVFSGSADKMEYLNSLGVNTSSKLWLHYFSVGVFHELFKNEYRLGFQASLHEMHYNLGIYTGFSIRPGYSSVWVNKGDNLYWQLREKRSFFHLTLEKRFNFWDYNYYPHLGAYIAYQFAVSSGKYDGSVLEKPENQIFNVPCVGLYLRFSGIGFSTGYRYYHYKNDKHEPSSVINMALDFYFKTSTSRMKRL